MRAKKIIEAIDILTQLGLPKEQQNERSALCLLALLDIPKSGNWQSAKSRLIGITPMMEFVKEKYDKEYAPNSRETFRRQTMHQFMDAGIALYNPDDPERPVNSPKAVYQAAPELLALIRLFGTTRWKKALAAYLKMRPTLIQKYRVDRDMKKIAVRISEGEEALKLSPGKHSKLIRDIIEEFATRFAPGSELVYAGDTGKKYAYFNKSLLTKLGVKVNSHGKMPDVVLYFEKKRWLILVESVTSHGPVDGKRQEELKNLFKDAKVGSVYVTAFPSRTLMAKYLSHIAWETEVWVADAPEHLIHFNGERFLGPYND